MDPAISPEGIFGGAVLLVVLTLIVTGKMRLEREVTAKDEIVGLKDRTIAEQSETIKDQRRAIEAMVPQGETMLRLLRELRDMAAGDAR